MSEWEEKLNTLLSDPDAMAQVMNMAQNLSQQMGQSGGSAPPPPPAGETTAFLRALRPFLKPERQDKVERAAQLARFIHLGKTLLLSEGGPRNV